VSFPQDGIAGGDQPAQQLKIVTMQP